MLKIVNLALIIFFYFCSYFFAIWGIRHEKVLKTELARLEQVAYSQYQKGLPIFIIDNFELKLKIKTQANLLRSQGKIYPNYGSMFLYNGTIYVVGN